MNAQATALKALLDGLPAKERGELIQQYAPASAGPDFKLYRMADAARALSVSRSTLWRMIKDGEIRTVEIRAGSKRIPASELKKFSNLT